MNSMLQQIDRDELRGLIDSVCQAKAEYWMKGENPPDDVIEEYMFIHTKNKKLAVHNVPSAISAAKMFFEMINMDSIAINFCNEKIY